MKILVTGGAGYIGSALVPRLLESGHDVTVLDCLLHGGDSLLPLFSYPNFTFVRGDILDRKVLGECVQGQHTVIHLAAIVGYPACRKHPRLAEAVNIEGTRNLLAELAESQHLIYASTQSNYGANDAACDETTPLNPLSLYGQTKTRAEQLAMERPNSTALRFATAFGVAPRLRLDLLINDFAYLCLSQGYLVIYEKDYRRTFLHVRDIARAIQFALYHVGMRDAIFNVGAQHLNCTKQELGDLLAKKTGAYIHYASVGTDADQRNYDVCCQKLADLGFIPSLTIEQGVDELLRALQVVGIPSRYHNV